MKKAIIAVILAILIIPAAAYALLNPAAVYCSSLGYEYIIENTNLGELGICRLPNNVEVDAWKFLKGEIAQSFSYCTRKGYGIETVENPELCSRLWSKRCAVCLAGDGKFEVTQLMGLDFKEGYCGDGNCGYPENFDTCPKDCTCKNECRIDEIRCNGKYEQECENYDQDVCMEWPASTSGEGNTYCELGCENNQCNRDSDKDKVLDTRDMCPETALPEKFKIFLFMRYGDVDGDLIFEVRNKLSKPAVDSEYTLKDTYGCSCMQMLELKPGKNIGEISFGCTKPTLTEFINKNGWARNLFK